ncbi:MAG: VCBS repeat-containing protein [Planctomycetes bacterium]|nr:VCBS repeat-containing protein [Planctomycetota bacterium]
MIPRASRLSLAFAVLGAASALRAQQEAVLWDVAEVFLWDSDMPCTGIVEANGDAYPDLICDDSYIAGGTRTRRLGVRTGGVWHRNSLALLSQVSEPELESSDAQWALPADADADGAPDLYWCAGSKVRVYRLPSTSAGFAPWGNDLDVGAQLLDAAVADVTGDGRADFLGYANGELVFAERAGASWQPILRLPFVVRGTPQLFVGETDGDPQPEVLLCDDAHVWSLRAESNLLVADLLDAHGCVPAMPVAGDIDGDGDSDVVVFDDTDFTVFRRVGATTFAAESRLVGGPATQLVDLDGDGDLDGVCCGGGGPTRAPNYVLSPFRLALNTGNGVFAPAVEIPGIGAQHLAGAVDLDADGDVDLIGGRARVFARGQLLPRATCASGLPSQPLSAPVDLDGDGDLDHEGDAPGAIWICTGDGRFRLEERLALSARGHELRAPVYWIDLDGDGDRDQIAQRHVAGIFDGSTRLENRGGWLFDLGPGSANRAPVGGSSTSFPAGRALDLDGDGDQDLVTYSLSTYACELWQNQAGVLTAWLALPSEIAMAAADFDLDGAFDLLVADGGLGIRYGLGGGAFAPRTALVPGSPQFFQAHPPSFDPWVDELAMVDLGTFAPAGHLDIVAFHREDPHHTAPAFDRVRAILNLGARSFDLGSESWLLGGTNVGCFRSNPTLGRRVRVLDVDGNGSLDILSSPVRYDEGSWRLGLRDPLQGNVIEGPELLLRGEHFADSDGDGDLDGLGALTDPGTRWFGVRSGSRVQFGIPAAGNDGVQPILGTALPQRTGWSDVLRLRGALGGAPAAIFLGTQRTQIYLGPELFFAIADPVLAWAGYLDGASGVPGAGSMDLAFPPLPGYFAGARFGVQALIYDPAAASAFSATPGLWLEKGW